MRESIPFDSGQRLLTRSGCVGHRNRNQVDGESSGVAFLFATGGRPY